MIDPRHPNYADTPAADTRPRFGYRPLRADAAPQATIITPFYNTGEVFHETARCVLNQSLQAFEWIIINDASRDPASLALLEPYRACDPRVRVIDHPINRGLSGARNTGFRAARTPFVLQLDSDDLIEPTTLEKSAWFLHSYPEYAFVKGYTVGFGTLEYLWERGFQDGAEFLIRNSTTATAMIRRDVQQAVGGFDESIRGGMEDWDFWLRCAAAGHWGNVIPEYLDWYRRRDDAERPWDNLDNGRRAAAFAEQMRSRYPALWDSGLPSVTPAPAPAYAAARETPPLINPLEGGRRRLLLILPWLRLGGADKFNLDLIGQLARRGWEVTIATTLGREHPWLPDFARITPDLFSLPSFLRATDHPVFLRYLIESRRPDVVCVSNSELGYLLLPYLRSVCPAPAYVDYVHMEEEYWKSGGYPRYAAGYQPILDLTVCASEHLKRWVVERCGDAARVEVATINVDADAWRPDERLGAETRRALEVPDDAPLVLYAGRLCDQKRPKIFAAVMHALARRKVAYAALVAGDGPDRAWLEDYLARNELAGRVRVLGAVPSGRMRALLAASDVFFLPSLWEGIALSIYEAMAMGVAVLGADVGGQRELVTPECGILLPRGGGDDAEIARYADALEALLRDAPRRRELGRAARARIESSFRLDDMGTRMDALLTAATESRRTLPTPLLPAGFEREAAALAIECARLESAGNDLWAQIAGSRTEITNDQAALRLRAVEKLALDKQAEAERLAAAWEEHVRYIRMIEGRLAEANAERERLRRGVVPRTRRFVGRILRATGVLPSRDVNGDTRE